MRAPRKVTRLVSRHHSSEAAHLPLLLVTRTNGPTPAHFREPSSGEGGLAPPTTPHLAGTTTIRSMRYSKASEPLLGFILAVLTVLVSLGDAVAEKIRTAIPQANLNYLSIFVADRSEEHTSELQSRFGISYAVFC